MRSDLTALKDGAKPEPSLGAEVKRRYIFGFVFLSNLEYLVVNKIIFRYPNNSKICQRSTQEPILKK